MQETVTPFRSLLMLDNLDIAKRIQELRGTKTKSSFSKKVDLTVKELNEIENGLVLPNSTLLSKIQSVTGCSFEYLINGVEAIKLSDQETKLLSQYSKAPIKAQSTILMLLTLGVIHKKYNMSKHEFDSDLDLSSSLSGNSLHDKVIRQWRLSSIETQNEIYLILLGVQTFEGLKPLTFEQQHKICSVFGKSIVLKSKSYFAIRDIMKNMKVFYLEDTSNTIIKSGELAGGFDVLAEYTKSIDAISFHNLHQFNSINEYLLCLLHEIGHATGHTSRLNRNTLGSKEETTYATEELIALYFSDQMALKLGITSPRPDWQINNITRYEGIINNTHKIKGIYETSTEIVNYVMSEFVSDTYSSAFKA